MLSRIAGIARALKSYLALEHRTPVYMERADYYRQQAVMESVKNSVHIDRDKGVDSIDIAETTAITLPNDRGRQVEFAIDRNGIYFARIEGGKYFPIDIKPSEDLLEKARHFEEASRSYLRRLLREPKEYFHFGRIMYSLDHIRYDLSDIVFRLEQLAEKLQQSVEPPQQSIEPLEQTVRKLHDKSGRG